MNANELADEVEMWGKDLLALNMRGGIPVIEGAKMLREQQRTIDGDKRLINLLYGKIDQQQEQIEALITEREQNAQNIDQISKSLPNGNEPVAWMLKTGHGTKIVEKKPYCEVDYWIPLYTHPAKTLTDEEISQVYKEVSEPFGEKRLYEIHDFARAILRKAQEK